MPWALHLPRPATTVVLALGLATFFATYEQGSFGTGIWTVEAAVVWWLLLLSLILRPAARPVAWPGVATATLLAAFAAFSGFSAFWASGPEQPVLALARGLFYVGVLMAALRFATSADAPAWCDGVCAGLVAVEALALASRFFSQAFSAGVSAPVLPDAYTRLSYPVGYWNGLAVVAALSCPLILRRSISNGRRSSLALVAFPAAVTVAYLASSRTGMIAITVGTAAFVALTRRREAVAAAAAGAVTAAVVVAVVSRIHSIVDGPFRSSASTWGGRWAALVVVAGGLAAVALYTPLVQAVRRLTLPRGSGRGALAAAFVIFAVLLVVAHPVRRWREFTQPPPTFTQAGYIQSHFLSANGNWRYQFWHASIDEFKSSPLRGRGAGSFTSWWEGHGPGFVANPHSLYFETLGDLGIVGLSLLAAAFVVASIAAIRRLTLLERHAAEAAAAGIAAFVAFAVAAGVDWLWQLPAVTGVALLLLGVALSPLARQDGGNRSATRFWAAAAAVIALAVVALEVDLKVGDRFLASSRAAAGRGAFSKALSDAHVAHSLEPWASSPQLQIALVQESRGQLQKAEDAVEGAIAADSGSWQTFFVAARIQRKRGEDAAASRSLAEAHRLNPHSAAVAAAKAKLGSS